MEKMTGISVRSVIGMIYIQFTAVVGALSLLSLLSDIVELQ